MVISYQLTFTVLPSLLISFLFPLEYQTSCLPSLYLFSLVPLSGSTITSVTSDSERLGVAPDTRLTLDSKESAELNSNIF